MAEFLNPGEEVTKRRHKLPHWQQGDVWIFHTYRLADSLPEAMLEKWREERGQWLQRHPEPWDEATEEEYHVRFSQDIDRWLDQGHGSCLLRNPANLATVGDAFHHFDDKRYELASYVVMPNHVHVLFRPLGDHTLSALVHSWKRFTAREINRHEHRTGTLWQPDYWDRLIRSRRHDEWVLHYIRANPMKLPGGTYRLWPS
jgi:REP element-mobilizing transposase RayT